MGVFGMTMEEMQEDNRLKTMMRKIAQEEISAFINKDTFRLFVHDMVAN